MKILGFVIPLVALLSSANASAGDRLVDFQDCLSQCMLIETPSSKLTIFEKVENERQGGQDVIEDGHIVFQKSSPPPPSANNEKRQQDGRTSRIQFSEEDFSNARFDMYSPLKVLWSIDKNCNYKCQQLITDSRVVNHESMLQFYGKWPFIRVFGMQEFYSTIFSMANFYVNYKNVYRVLLQVRKNSKDHPHGGVNVYAVMLKQFLYLIIVSLVGWVFSTVFHIYDNAMTETLDYFGASAIIMMTFSCIVIRYFELFKSPTRLKLWQVLVGFIYCGHCLRLYLHWDYAYNTTFNLIIGVLTILLWTFHAFGNYRQFKRHYIIYNNSIQLLPFETKILKKVNIPVRWIPLIPVGLNIWLIMGMMFEIFEFTPWFRLIDGHAMWHLWTIFPPLLWYDWNIWDMEMMKITDKLVHE